MMRAILKLTVAVCLAGSFLLFPVGCGKKNAAALTTANDEAFKSATPEVKAAWETAKAAMKTNGYAAAIMSLQTGRALPGVNPQQAKAFDETVTAVSDQMYDAANRDDPAGKQAIEDLRGVQAR
jgi:hypothetical protein